MSAVVAERGHVPAAGASAEAIQAHYDVSNAFYRLWLDPSMTYSCALWDGAETLEAAQLAKLDLHLCQSRAGAGKRLLDVGCGWGALLERAVTHHGVREAVGLTLSAAQRDGAKHAPGANVRLESWQAHQPTAPYDAIVSIGAFEHFVKPGLARVDKVEAYRNFFAWCHRHSVPGSWLSLQSIVYEDYDEQVPNEFVKEIFPESDLPRLSEAFEAMQGLYEVVVLRNDREHYAKTLQMWLSSLRRQRTEVIALHGEDLYRRYERYLGIFVVGFHVGTVNLTRFAARRIDG
jgi:cyclopropane-fatty-acyl-phospholipid synthase